MPVKPLAAIRIRFGCPAELATLEEIQRRASLAWEEDRAALLAHPESIHLPIAQLEERRVRVAEIADELVGFSVMLPRTAGMSELDGLFVAPARWRMGIGWALMNDAVDLARLQDARTIEVTAHPRAEGFYSKFGFIRMGSTQTQFGPAMRMRYKLAAQTDHLG